jgi:hypothetical protein
MHMKRSIMFGVLFSTALAVGASAQATGGQTPPQAGSGSTDQVTVTGCLQSGDAGGATGTSGTGSTAAGTGAATGGGARGGFVLTNAKMGSGSASGGTGASSTGTTGSATGASPSGTAAGMTRYKLEGSQSDLQKYANSQVEISGKLDKSMGSGAGAAGSATTGATGATGATGSGAAATGSARQEMPTLHVSSVRQVSPTCAGS